MRVTPFKSWEQFCKGALVEVDVGLLADKVREATTDTLDGAHGVHHLLATVNVGVEDTQHVLEVLGHHERHDGRTVVLHYK